MFERYSHLYRTSDTSSFATVATDVHSKENLKYKFVARFDNGKSEYRVFGSLSSFLKYYTEAPAEEKMLHEIIFSGRQRIKFDIDCSADMLAKLIHNRDNAPSFDPVAEYAVIVSIIIAAIKDSFFNAYDIVLDDSDIAICESTMVGKKYSTHIILPKYAVSSNVQAHEFALQTRNFIRRDLWGVLDVGVYNSTQSFRAVMSQKPDGRIKRLITNHTPEDTIINALHPCIFKSTTLLPDIVTSQVAHIEIDLHPDDISAVIQKCVSVGILNDHAFKRNQGTLFMFDRTRASVCDICSERTGSLHEHSVDATLSVFIYYDHGNMINIYRQCRRDRQHAASAGTKRITKMVGSVMSSVMRAEPMDADCATISAKWIDREIIRAIDTAIAPVTKFASVVSNITRHIYCEDQLRDFEHARTLVVHAPMKIGKTKKLREHLDTHYIDNTCRIVFVSFRQTFSSNIKEKFPEFTLYSDVKGPLDYPRIIVQVESLHRIVIREGQQPPDLLILDECESIFEQFNSGLLRGNFNECFAKFLYMIKSAAHVICMDAMITDRTYNILRELRPDHVNFDRNLSTVYHRNTVQNASSDAYYLFGDKARWLVTLYRAIDAGQKIAVPISSLTEAKGIVETIANDYPRIRVGFYSSETTYRERREHFGKVNDIWSQYDVLVYTPTISAGVSFEQKHFDSVFGYFTDQSCPVETCIQMIGRIRDVKSKNYFIFMDAKGSALPATRSAINARLQDTRTDLFRDLDATGAVSVEYTETGAKRVHTGPYFTLWVENIVARNSSRNSFVRKFVSYLRAGGCDIDHVCKENFQDMLEGCELTGIDEVAPIELCLKSATSIHANAKISVKDREHALIAGANDIDHDIAAELSSQVQNQIDISIDEKNALAKYWLKTVYNVQWEITPKFVATYRNPKMMKIYKNLCKMTNLAIIPPDWSGTPLDYALKSLQAEERGMHGYLMTNNRSDDDINKNYMFTQHYTAISLLKILGWNDIFDGGYIGKNAVTYRVREASLREASLREASLREASLQKFVDNGSIEFNIRKPRLDSSDENNVTSIVKFTSQILTLMYGIKIVTSGDLFRIVRPTEFTDSYEEAMLKHIPCYGRTSADVPIEISACIDDDAEIVIIDDL